MKRLFSNRIFIWGGAVILLLVGAVYFAFEPSSASWFPKCAVYQLTGLKCAGCGSQRAIHALLHGNITEAWSMNAFFVLMIPVVAFLAWLEFKRKAYPRLYNRVYHPLIILFFGIAVVAWTIGRNIF